MPNTEKILWYTNRLASMSAPELVHRICEAVKKRIDRHNTRLAPKAQDYGLLPHIPGLREKLALWQVPPELLAQWQRLFERAKSGRLHLLNQEWPDCPRARRWHLDPVTFAFWPHESYCFAIDYRHVRGIGDVKYVWELNRLQYLQFIAAYACWRNDAAAAKFVLEEIESWIDSNPPHIGINWVSGIELAFRAISILVAVTLVGEHATPEQRKKIWGTLQAHALWLERYPSRFSSANNHLTAEGLGLFIIGTLCPQLKGAARFRAYGWPVLCKAALTQILPDGVGAEQAVGYTAVLAEMLLLGLHIARSCDMEAPGYYVQRLALTGEYLRWLTDADGNQPLIGDDDNASVIGLHSKHHVSSVLGCIAALTQRGDIAPPYSAPVLRNVLFGFPPSAAEAPRGLRSFREGGYSIYRQENAVLAFDHGPLGYLSIAAHGHADALAVWLHIGGRPVLVDAGTYLYHSGGAWRTYFRGTRAHNTLCMIDADSSIMSGNFNWSHKARARLLSGGTDENGWHMEAEHDGYMKHFGALHRRRLDGTLAGFTITDSITGTTAQRIETGFLLHPGLHVIREGNEIHILEGEHRLLALTCAGPLEPAIAQGWYSPAFGVRQAATRIVFSGMLAPDEKMLIKAHYD